MLLLHEVDARIYDVDIPEQGVTSRTAPRCRSCRSWCVWPSWLMSGLPARRPSPRVVLHPSNLRGHL